LKILLNPERSTSEELKSRRLPTPGLGWGFVHFQICLFKNRLALAFTSDLHSIPALWLKT